MRDPGDAGGAAADPATPAELADRLERAQFTVAFRGFEPTEVQELLRSVAAELRAMGEGDAEAARPVRPPAPVVDAGPGTDAGTDHEGLGATMRLRRAEHDAAELHREARAEAERIVEDARREAQALTREAAGVREEARAAVLDAVRQATEILARARREAGEAGAAVGTDGG